MRLKSRSAGELAHDTPRMSSALAPARAARQAMLSSSSFSPPSSSRSQVAGTAARKQRRSPRPPLGTTATAIAVAITIAATRVWHARRPPLPPPPPRLILNSARALGGGFRHHFHHRHHHQRHRHGLQPQPRSPVATGLATRAPAARGARESGAQSPVSTSANECACVGSVITAGVGSFIKIAKTCRALDQYTTIVERVKLQTFRRGPRRDRVRMVIC